MDSAEEASCTHDHQLIANCLDFIDSEAQVRTSNLSPGMFFYLPTLFHFIVNSSKETQYKDHSNQNMVTPSAKPHVSVEKELDNSAFESPMLDPNSKEEGSQSITSNIRHLVEEKLIYLQG